jgi:CRISPR/Cas system-associated exonuclease Cas4 (RecB family)
MIVERIMEAKARKIKQYPVNTNRASELGHPCLRYHVYNRTAWQEKALHDARLQMIFDLGKEIEDIVMDDLREAGLDVIEQQRSFSWSEYLITGHIDGKLLIDGEAIPFEVKSCSPYVFKTINGIDDLKRGKYLYLRKYPCQLNLYLLMDNQPRGVFIFKDKSSGQYKEVWMDIDYALGEEALQRAEAINAHVTAGTIPEAPEYNPAMCDDCPFSHVCVPDRVGHEVEVIDSEELLGLLERYENLKPLAGEFKEVDDQIKATVEGREKLLIGPYFVSGKWVETTRYNVPKEVKDQYREPSQYWKKAIQKVA